MNTKKDTAKEIPFWDHQNKNYKYTGFRLKRWHSDILWYLIPLLCFSAGLLYPNRDTWLNAFRDAFVFLAVGVSSTQFIWEFLSPFLAYPTFERIQSSKKELPLYYEELRDSLNAYFVIATLIAWPLAKERDGYPTAFKKTIGEAAYFDSYTYYLVKIVVTAFFSDTWTYWKHYMYHHPAVYAIHKDHHAYHNPSTFAGYAIHPAEIFATFCPIVIMCVPSLNLYAPLHFTFLGFFYCLNLYMHCGYYIPLLEKVLPMFYLDTSTWHNTHHNLRVVNFGEMFTFWDLHMGTHALNWDKEKLQRVQDKCVEESNVHRGVSEGKSNKSD